jgi:inhibitor of KinA
MAGLRVAAAGDSALLIELPPRIDPAINDRAIALARALERRCGSALRDVVVGYCSLTVYFDPLAVDGAWLEAEVRQEELSIEHTPEPQAAVVEVPVCYGADCGPDLADVAAFAGCSESEVIERHSAVTYRVYLLGFLPGFPYMAEVDPRIAAPRRATPRTAVPAGSVGIAGGQTGIYPSVTPGGWNIVGRTPVTLFDPGRSQPFLFQPGDRVRFRPIGRDELDRQVR